MPFADFPSKFIYWTQISDEIHENIKRELVPEVEEDSKKHGDNKPFSLGRATTNYSQENKNGQFLIDDYYLDNIVWEPLEKMMKEYNNTKVFPILLNKSIVSGSWYTLYDEDDSFGPHSHYNNNNITLSNDNEIFRNSFSFIYILKDDNEKNQTVFMVDDPSCMISPSNIIEYDTGDNESIKEGTVIIFPSNLLHYVKNVKIPGRITISYNLNSSFHT